LIHHRAELLKKLGNEMATLDDIALKTKDCYHKIKNTQPKEGENMHTVS
jgi:hypothetical protein